MKGEKINFFLPVTIAFPSLLKERERLRTQLNVGKMIESGERKERKMSLGFADPSSRKQGADRFCATGKSSNSLMGPPDSTIKG